MLISISAVSSLEGFWCFFFNVLYSLQPHEANSFNICPFYLLYIKYLILKLTIKVFMG